MCLIMLMHALAYWKDHRKWVSNVTTLIETIHPQREPQRHIQDLVREGFSNVCMPKKWCKKWINFNICKMHANGIQMSFILLEYFIFVTFWPLFILFFFFLFCFLFHSVFFWGGGGPGNQEPPLDTPLPSGKCEGIFLPLVALFGHHNLEQYRCKK